MNIYGWNEYMENYHRTVHYNPKQNIVFTTSFFFLQEVLSSFEDWVSFRCILIFKYRVFILQTDILF